MKPFRYMKTSCFCMEVSEIDKLSACHRFVTSETIALKGFENIYRKKSVQIIFDQL